MTFHLEGGGAKVVVLFLFFRFLLPNFMKKMIDSSVRCKKINKLMLQFSTRNFGKIKKIADLFMYANDLIFSSGEKTFPPPQVK